MTLLHLHAGLRWKRTLHHLGYASRRSRLLTVLSKKPLDA